MSNYNKSIGQGKLGINLIRSFVDENHCYFNEIKQENDVGIDAIIEFTENGENNGKCIAVQIKNGNSYFNKTKTYCKIPIKDHYTYWKNHTLVVYGIVCDCSTNSAYWVSITDYVRKYSSEIESGKIKTISFPIMEINTINKQTFDTLFKRLVYGVVPIFSYEQAMKLSYSKYPIERKIAVDVLSTKYADNVNMWDRLFELLETEADCYVLFYIIKYISYIPHHPDLWGDLNFSKESKNYGAELIKSINCSLIVKMLSLTEESGIERGTIGQSIESIISLVPNNEKLLKNIIDDNASNHIGVDAFLILAYYNSSYVIENKDHYIRIIGDLANTVISFCEEFGYYDLYI